jgi:hypothetical protein
VLEQGAGLDYHYVMHFSKQRLKPVNAKKFQVTISPRNTPSRTSAQKGAMGLAAALDRYPYLRDRVRGIDGCSYEIGCRPETFATEFRFLRQLVVNSNKNGRKHIQELPPVLGSTYHAGEDFLDIINGLRAVDEAIRFLNLKSGDRIGHAIALGIDPDAYYQQRKGQVVLTKQDRLDDLVWLIFRSQELGVDLGELRARWRNEATELFRQVYRPVLIHRDGNGDGAEPWQYDLECYYRAWKLRGNHPDLVSLSELHRERRFETKRSLGYQYIAAKKDPYAPLHKNTDPAGVFLYHCYHYSFQVRKLGQETIMITTEPEYPAICRKMQDALLAVVEKKGIAIECNPSSNVLISYFSRYDEHPIFRFNREGLDAENGTAHPICVSINTDDQGVFDTSLENEYALIAAALSECTENGVRVYNDEQIHTYLRNLCTMGEQQTFPSRVVEQQENWRTCK